MPLTEEQKALIEQKRQAALAKRSLTKDQKAMIEAKREEALARRQERKKLSDTELSARLESPSSLEAAKPIQGLKPSNAPTLEPKRRPVNIAFSLISTSRFNVIMGYDETVVGALRTVKSALYQPSDRTWSFDLADHNEVLAKIKGLGKHYIVDPLPHWVINILLRKTFKLENVSEESLESALEPTLYNTLMPFQKEGITFGLRRRGRVLIADDMGLGKTIQALGIATVFRTKWPLLIVCPSSVRFSWQDAIVRWIPSLPEDEIKILTSSRDSLEGFAVVILSYDLLSKKERELVGAAIRVVIMDESHFLKNFKSNRTKTAEKILKRAEHVILLSGTPVLSRPIELFPQISSVMPKLFPYVTDYGMRYCEGKKVSFGGQNSHFDFQGSSNMNELKIILEETCMIRRLKSEVLDQLPSKQRKMVVLDPSSVKSNTKEMKNFAKDISKSKPSTNQYRSVLLQWFNSTAESKIQAVVDYLRDLLETGRKFICFAHHQVMLNAIGDLLCQRGVRFIRIDGNTSSESRNNFCQQFQYDDETRVALLSITAANSGITLTSAQLVVFAELYWNPGILTQAEDRAHRIGQTDSVVVQYLVAKGTADDELWPLLQKKLDVLNKAGLSKDNFTSTSTTCANVKSPSNKLITDFLKEKEKTTILNDIDLESWEDDDFNSDVEMANSPPKKIRTENT